MRAEIFWVKKYVFNEKSLKTGKVISEFVTEQGGNCLPSLLWIAIFAIIIYIPQVDINICYRCMSIELEVFVIACV